MTYWINETSAPDLSRIQVFPGVENIICLAFLNIDRDLNLKWEFLLGQTNKTTLITQIDHLRSQGAKVLMSIQEAGIVGTLKPGHTKLLDNLVQVVKEWHLDGFDIDYEDRGSHGIQPAPDLPQFIAKLREQLQKAKPDFKPCFAAPIWGPFLGEKAFLKSFCDQVDYVSTMDYSPYGSVDETVDTLKEYAKAIGGWSKLIVGISCMTKSNNFFTPKKDIPELLYHQSYETGKSPVGLMLWTHTYDVPHRNTDEGTGEPAGSRAKAMHAALMQNQAKQNHSKL